MTSLFTKHIFVVILRAHTYTQKNTYEYVYSGILVIHEAAVTEYCFKLKYCMIWNK